ncbi:MAG: GntR family transcriptional regulator [Bryobacterales bacterium]|nr:GntR family transcriptional regulator [Bryobacterales bacterium]
MSALLTQPRATSIRQGALDLLREALLSGQFQPGQQLTEVGLSTQLRISRGPVREALLMLTQEGLVNHHPHHGFSVVSWNPEDGAAMARVRLPLEAMALELARAFMDAAKLRELEAIQASILAGVAAQNVSQWIRADLRFHEKIWEWSGNVWLIQALRRITYPFFAFSLIYHKQRTPPATETMEHIHDTLVRYLSGACDLTAEQCVRLHLERYSVR